MLFTAAIPPTTSRANFFIYLPSYWMFLSHPKMRTLFSSLTSLLDTDQNLYPSVTIPFWMNSGYDLLPSTVNNKTSWHFGKTALCKSVPSYDRCFRDVLVKLWIVNGKLRKREKDGQIEPEREREQVMRGNNEAAWLLNLLIWPGWQFDMVYNKTRLMIWQGWQFVEVDNLMSLTILLITIMTMMTWQQRQQW